MAKQLPLVARWLSTCLMILLAAAGGTHADQPASGLPALRENSCVDCHRDLDAGETKGPTLSIEHDIHATKGLGCQACHGGDPTIPDEEAMDPARGFIGRPAPAEIPDFCGRCHSDPAYMRSFNPGIPVDQVQKYWTSHHGQRLEAGNVKVATCVSCHAVHDIRPADDRRSSVHPINLPETCGACHADPAVMAGSSLPTNQLELFRESVHGRALLEKGEIGSPSCNDCHGNHAAMPPDVSRLSRVCGLCHVQNLALFQESVHAGAFAENDLPECEACHGNHGIKPTSDDQVGDQEGAVCLDCHSPDDGTAGLTPAAAMHKALVELKERQAAAEADLHEVEVKGMVVTDAFFDLADARQQLIKARTQVHAFDADLVLAETSAGIELVVKAEKIAAHAREQYRFRRNGLGLSTLVLTVVVVLLAVKIRRIERG